MPLQRTRGRVRGATAELAEWAGSLRIEDLPDSVIDRVLAHTLDTVGAILVGATQPWTRTVAEYASVESPTGRSRSAALDRTLRPEWAALINGTAAHGFEIDDYALPGLSHPGSVVVPSAFALGEDRGISGRALIVALAAGFESIVRFGEACTPSLTSHRGFHVTSALGVFGSAASAVSVHGLTADQGLAALGIAAAHASGTTEFTRTGGDIKRLHAGMAAAAGIRSAALATGGFTAPLAAIEGERGFLAAFVEQARPEQLTAQLGHRWALDGLALKRWCVCAGIQAPLAGLDAILREGDIRPEDITAIEVGVDRATLAHVGHIGGSPRDMTEAQMSLHHAMAMRLVAGGNDPLHYTLFEQGLDVAAQADRVSLHVDDAAEEAFPRRLLASVTVHTATATATTVRAEAPGTPTTPMDRGARLEKFHALADPLIGERDALRLINAVDALREDGPVSAVLAHTRKAQHTA
ncbi:MmgE/PrpD family protein [Microbacterium lushaniae]|uniref:MmgE/PrpD family protein n=1 Tax=Microbacterium lushaniae TaxID=2614639 RepID=A0A5J6L148_9MICO|nr:MmgE/PrpD family protein [Microbacterium lushaniae]